MNTRSIAKAAAAMLAAVAMLGAGGLAAGTALADDPASSPSAPFTPTASAGTIIIHDAPEPSDGSTNNLVPASVDGRTFTAYELGSYADVQVTGSNVTGMNLVNASGVTNADVMAWIKAAAKGVNPAGTEDGQLKLLDANDNIVYQGGSFVGDATNMSPLQFVARYFYGTGADRFGNDHANNMAMRLFAKAAQATIGNASDVTKATAQGKDGQATFANLPEGVYLIVEQPVSGAAANEMPRAMVAGTTITNGQSIIKSATGRDGQAFTLGQINLKAEKVEVQKTTPGDLLSQIGSSHEFTITTNVPNYGDYQDWTDPQFSISDSPTSNLTTQFGDDNAGIVVTANGATLKSGTDYTVTKAADGNGFTVTLSNPLKQSGEAITVTYKAVVNAVDVDKTNNTATVTFDNDPQDHSSHGTGTTESTKHLYVASVPLQKIAFNDPDTILSGAQFTVTAGTANTPVKFHDYGNGVYGIVKDGAVDAQGNPIATVDHITSNDSKIVIKGLDADSTDATTYTFRETVAPTDYLLGDNPVQFTLTVTPTYKESAKKTLSGVTYSMDSANYKNFIDSASSMYIKDANGENVAVPAVTDKSGNDTTTELAATDAMVIENTKNPSDFAKTGGEITRVLVAVAILAVIGAVFLLLARARRRSSNG